MQSFPTYLQLGYEHISDLQGYDHMLFIITLCAIYTLQDWKKVLILVTAFTVGHSLTLALAVLDIFRLPQDLVEFLIPITIFLTALSNVLDKQSGKRSDRIHYGLALMFGFIHGMGFSNFFRALQGSDESIATPLFAFNVGLELGQLLIVTLFFLFYRILLAIRRFEHHSWNLFISGAGAGVALIMILEKIA